MSDTTSVPTKLLWVDLEMTGLDANEDVILEVAAEVTDFNFKTLGSYEARVKQPHDVVVDRMAKNTWWADFPENRDDFVGKLGHGKDLAKVEKNLIKLVEEHFGTERAVLAGNSIYNDRKFVAQWWPALNLKLHYRMLDVSAWKVFMQGRYAVDFEKANAHRAFDDIQASISELQYYLEWFAINKDKRDD